MLSPLSESTTGLQLRLVDWCCSSCFFWPCFEKCSAERAGGSDNDVSDFWMALKDYCLEELSLEPRFRRPESLYLNNPTLHALFWISGVHSHVQPSRKFRLSFRVVSDTAVLCFDVEIFGWAQMRRTNGIALALRMTGQRWSREGQNCLGFSAKRVNRLMSGSPAFLQS